MMKGKSEWLLCPACKKKTRIKVYENTELKNFPLFCPKCKKETLRQHRTENCVQKMSLRGKIKT